jgi:hypothetical protein
MPWPSTDACLERYDPYGHALARCILDLRAAENWLAELTPIIPRHAAGTLLWFGIEWDRTGCRYSSPASLVWRDVGALLATLTFVAEATQLAVLPLGATGEPWFSRMICSNGAVTGGGGCLIGEFK